MLPYNQKLIKNAQKLRKNMTKEEKHLWYEFLKKLPITVRRQHNIENYIVDFYIADKKIVIEVDGGQHYIPENQKADAERDAKLNEWGITVLRYTNREVDQNFYGVTVDIMRHLGIEVKELRNY